MIRTATQTYGVLQYHRRSPSIPLTRSAQIDVRTQSVPCVPIKRFGKFGLRNHLLASVVSYIRWVTTGSQPRHERERTIHTQAQPIYGSVTRIGNEASRHTQMLRADPSTALSTDSWTQIPNISPALGTLLSTAKTLRHVHVQTTLQLHHSRQKHACTSMQNG